MKRMFGIVAVILWMVSSSSVLAHNANVVSTLSIRGQSILMVEPDQVSVSIGVVSEANKVKVALRDNGEKMRNAIELLASLDFSQDDYKTQNFSVSPNWSSRSSNSSVPYKRKIIGYSVNNTLRITTTRLDDIGDIIAAVASAGVNQIQSIHFDLKNPRQYREQAIQAASDNAKKDAVALAKANGVRLIKVRSVNLDNASASISQVPKAAVLESRMIAADSAPPIQAGDIAVRASVSIVYEIDGEL